MRASVIDPVSVSLPEQHLRHKGDTDITKAIPLISEQRNADLPAHANRFISGVRIQHTFTKERQDESEVGCGCILYSMTNADLAHTPWHNALLKETRMGDEKQVASVLPSWV